MIALGILLLASAATTLISLAALLVGEHTVGTIITLTIAGIITIVLLIHFNRDNRRSA